MQLTAPDNPSQTRRKNLVLALRIAVTVATVLFYLAMQQPVIVMVMVYSHSTIPMSFGIVFLGLFIILSELISTILMFRFVRWVWRYQVKPKA